MSKIPLFLEAQLEKNSPLVRDAFLNAFQDIKDSVVLANLIDALERGRIDLVLETLNFDPAFMDEIGDALRAAYTGAGRAIMTGLPASAALVIRFDGRNPRAETWASQRSSNFVTEILNDQREAIRRTVSAGIAAGRGPRQTALEIVGRINKATGKREGGTIGLTSQQSGFASNARNQLTSGSEADLRQYLTRELRDRRYDGAVRRAIDTGRPIPAKQLESMVTSYSNRMLKHRGDVVARTETLTALNAGRREGLEQLVERGGIQRDKIKKVWRATGDARTRDTHSMMNGQQLESSMPFTTPTGFRLLFPGDSSLGAPPQETIQCRCWVEYKIDYLGMIDG